MRTLSLLPVALLLFVGQAIAQVPDTDILVMEMPQMKSAPREGAAANVTNRPGYDNQPAFSPDSRYLVYTSMRGDQTDIYRLDLQTNRITQLTYTDVSEYSPTYVPAGDRITMVVVEEDGSQHLWSMAPDGSDRQRLLPAVEPVGYHAWGDAQTVALYVLGDPATLQIADVTTNAIDTVASDIGRSLHHVPGRHAVSFVHHVAPGHDVIASYDLDTGAVDTIAPTLPGREDYVWAPDGSLWMADGPELYTYDPEAQAWQRVAGLGSTGIGGITRMAVSPDGRLLALVVEGLP